MKIENLQVFNFKSFDATGINLLAKPGLNIIVGEYGSGKSNMIEVFKALQSSIDNNSQFFNKDSFHNGRVNNPIRIKFTAVLEDDDISVIMDELSMEPSQKGDFLSIFGTQIRIHLECCSTLQQRISYFTSGRTVIFGNIAFQPSKIPYLSRDSTSWLELIQQSKQGKSLYALVEQVFSSQDSNSIQFPKEPIRTIKRILDEKLVFFQEFRYPQRWHEDSTSRGLYAQRKKVHNILYRLKNGGPEKEQKFNKIKELFCRFFQGLIFILTSRKLFY